MQNHQYLLLALLLCGCQSSRVAQNLELPGSGAHTNAVASAEELANETGSETSPVKLCALQDTPSVVDGLSVSNNPSERGQATAGEQSEGNGVEDSSAADADDRPVENGAFLPIPLEMQSAEVPSRVTLVDVIDSVHLSYPLVNAALQERALRDGNQISAWGEFDTKLKASSENQPLGFYETYRNKVGITNPLYNGGEVFAGYRNGGGDFEPWYEERETNNGGEFKAGFRVPLLRNRNIDARRAAVWRATYDQQIANPVIRQALIEFSREAGLAYWKWVAAGRKYQVGQQWLELAVERNQGMVTRKEKGDIGRPELIDNARAIAKREAKLADSLRALQQAAAKLALYFRDQNGQPVLLEPSDVPDFPRLRAINLDQQSQDSSLASSSRPEIEVLNLELQKLQVDYSEAVNMTQAALDAQLIGGQDVGEPTSSKRDKSEFELEASLFFEVPLQRRKGRGKMQAVQAKIAMVSAKRRIMVDKIQTSIVAVYAGLEQTRQEVLKAREAVRLASQMAEFERSKYDLGESDLLKVALREQYALEAAEDEINATLNHFFAFTDYAAILAIERPNVDLLPAVVDEDVNVDDN